MNVYIFSWKSKFVDGLVYNYEKISPSSFMKYWHYTFYLWQEKIHVVTFQLILISFYCVHQKKIKVMKYLLNKLTNFSEIDKKNLGGHLSIYFQCLYDTFKIAMTLTRVIISWYSISNNLLMLLKWK